MADLKQFAEQLVNLTVKEVNELATILKDEYGIEPAAAAVVVSGGAGAGHQSGGPAGQSKTETETVKPLGPRRIKNGLRLRSGHSQRKIYFLFRVWSGLRATPNAFSRKGTQWKAASYQAGGSGVSLRTVRWGGTLLPQAIGRAMEWPDSCPRRKLPARRLPRINV